MCFVGTGESGKSTVFKQLKIIHKDAYPPEECMKFKDTIFTNVLQCIRALIEGCEKLEIAFDSPDTQVCCCCCCIHISPCHLSLVVVMDN